MYAIRAYLAVGTDGSMVELWDGETCQPVRTMGGHEARVGSLAWNNHILSSGSRDSTVHCPYRVLKLHLLLLDAKSTCNASCLLIRGAM